ncbi:hypothetical protein ACFE04_006562 [Oxalis oulophora]
MISLNSSNTTGIKTFPLQYGEVLQPSHDSLVHSSTDKPYKINGRNSPTQKSENKRKYRNFLANADDHKQNTITGSTKDTKKYPKIQTKVPKKSVSNRTAGIDQKKLSVSLKISETGHISSIYIFNALVGMLLLILMIQD